MDVACPERIAYNSKPPPYHKNDFGGRKSNTSIHIIKQTNGADLFTCFVIAFSRNHYANLNPETLHANRDLKPTHKPLQAYTLNNIRLEFV